MTETFYDVLGVADGASSSEIEAAYRERVKEIHPDVSDAPDADVATRKLIRARDVLLDEDERSRYDRIGHDAYVGRTDRQTEGSGSTVADAARRAGYGNGVSPADGDGPTSSRATRDRASRERAASQRVRDERQRVQGATGTTDSARERHGATDRSGTDAHTAGGGTGAWNRTDAYSVRGNFGATPGYERLIPRGRALTLLGITFAFYPVLLFSALLPAFPLGVNLLVGLCTLCVVAYLQSVPTVAVLVFGAWSLITPIALAALGVGIFSIPRILVLCGTWLPFGFSLLTFTVVSN